MVASFVSPCAVAAFRHSIHSIRIVGHMIFNETESSKIIRSTLSKEYEIVPGELQRSK